MSSRIARSSKYLAYILLANGIYGFALYHLVTWLVGYSLLHAYLGNLAFIVLGLVWDEYTKKMYRSKKYIAMAKQEKNSEQNYRFFQWMINNFVSFKTTLYLFYIIILIVSQIINFYPALVNTDLGNFIRATDYTILLIVAFDDVREKFSRDREEMKKTSELFQEYWNKEPD